MPEPGFDATPAEGPLGHIRRATREKSRIHGLLEHSPAPTIRVADTVSGLVPATLRRVVAAVDH